MAVFAADLRAVSVGDSDTEKDMASWNHAQPPWEAGWPESVLYTATINS